jgi:hypothetical protein
LAIEGLRVLAAGVASGVHEYARPRLGMANEGAVPIALDEGALVSLVQLRI